MRSAAEVLGIDTADNEPRGPLARRDAIGQLSMRSSFARPRNGHTPMSACSPAKSLRRSARCAGPSAPGTHAPRAMGAIIVCPCTTSTSEHNTAGAGRPLAPFGGPCTPAARTVASRAPAILGSSSRTTCFTCLANPGCSIAVLGPVALEGAPRQPLAAGALGVVHKRGDPGRDQLRELEKLGGARDVLAQRRGRLPG